MDSRKAVTLSIKTVLLLMIGALVVLSIMGAWGAFEGNLSDTVGDSNQQAQDQSSQASCQLECRQEHLSGGGEYEACVQSCS
ncbi:hypothetical protein ACK3SF_00540 [Candidatus Nanosalina sp. VS9-1]|uniref:hypothetical protein n=1 Tax=Candidatus Nanosalina sp. VS9-1 TaxID=3388566 RepID=UPI0039DFBC78